MTRSHKNAQHNPGKTHCIEHAWPAEIFHDPAHEWIENGQGKILCGIENRRRQTPLVSGEPHRRDPAVARKRRSFADTHHKPKTKEEDKSGGAREESDGALKKGEERPDEQSYPVNPSRTQPIQKPTTGNLKRSIRPPERGKGIAKMDRIEAEVFADGRRGHGQGRSVGKVQRRDDK